MASGILCCNSCFAGSEYGIVGVSMFRISGVPVASNNVSAIFSSIIICLFDLFI